jgi:hypothetical protein
MTDNGGYYGSWGGQAWYGPTYWQNLYDSKAEWGPCFYDQTQNLTTYALYELPYGKNRKFGRDANPVLNAVAGEWNVSAILTFQHRLPDDPLHLDRYVRNRPWERVFDPRGLCLAGQHRE